MPKEEEDDPTIDSGGAWPRQMRCQLESGAQAPSGLQRPWPASGLVLRCCLSLADDDEESDDEDDMPELEAAEGGEGGDAGGSLHPVFALDEQRGRTEDSQHWRARALRYALGPTTCSSGKAVAQREEVAQVDSKAWDEACSRHHESDCQEEQEHPLRHCQAGRLQVARLGHVHYLWRGQDRGS
eukprot:scaffold2201_cov110-Isochrysis_galbana.AAC.6